jgi:hypothetical protein
MFLTCGFTGGSTEPYSELPGQSMITCVRGGIDPIPPRLGVSADLFVC